MRKITKTITILHIIAFFSLKFGIAQIEINSQIQANSNYVSYIYDKEEFGTYSVLLSDVKVENSTLKKNIFSIQGKHGTLFSLAPKNQTITPSIQFYYSVARGTIDSKVDINFPYSFPFEKGKKINFKRHENNFISNGDADNQHLIEYQFSTNTAERIYSMRRGLVVEVNKSPIKSDGSNYFKTLIKIEHPDGIIATYKGFNPTTIEVKPGDEILPHKPLGKTMKQGKSTACILKVSFQKLIISNNKFAYNSITPMIATELGNQMLGDNSNYTVFLSDEAIMKEMSKKEKKQYINR